VPPATGTFENAGAGVWKPPANDTASIWTIDRGETNTFVFVAMVPWQPERPRACFLQADYRCKPGSFLGVKVHGAYTWRRDELYTFDDDSGSRLSKHED